jgi:hypothetical protein
MRQRKTGWNTFLKNYTLRKIQAIYFRFYPSLQKLTTGLSAPQGRSERVQKISPPPPHRDSILGRVSLHRLSTSHDDPKTIGKMSSFCLYFLMIYSCHRQTHLLSLQLQLLATQIFKENTSVQAINSNHIYCRLATFLDVIINGTSGPSCSHRYAFQITQLI